MAYDVPSKIIKTSKELCKSILDSFGGSSALANSLGLDRQYFNKYMNLGYIPLPRLHEVRTILGVSEWALSYFKLMEIHGESSPALQGVIDKAPLLPAEKKRIVGLLK